jgi:hypothetical protein
MNANERKYFPFEFALHSRSLRLFADDALIDNWRQCTSYIYRRADTVRRDTGGSAGLPENAAVHE